jgi:hypothetical protein
VIVNERRVFSNLVVGSRQLQEPTQGVKFVLSNNVINVATDRRQENRGPCIQRRSCYQPALNKLLQEQNKEEKSKPTD